MIRLSHLNDAGTRHRIHPPPLALLFLSLALTAPGSVSGAESGGDLLAGCWNPPPEFAGQFGSYKSLLVLEDGTAVQRPEDWLKRRQELLDYWNRLMGPWPALIAHPRIEETAREPRESFLQKRIKVEIAPAQMAAGYLLIPTGGGPFPAVFIPYYEPETSVGLSKEKLRDFGLQLARRGFVTLSIGSPGGDAWRPEVNGAGCQPLSFLAYVAANCRTALAQLPEVDAARIGVVGHSYGGKWALFAACLDDRFACGVWSDPGIVFDESRPNVNYWEPWYLGKEAGRQRAAGVPTTQNPRTGAYRELVAAGHDLDELMALMAPRPFLISGGSEDPPARWLALKRVSEVYRLLGATNRVGLTARENHTPTPESNEQIYAFFERFLKPHRSR